ncbi:MAG: M23 family metallopeptidase [Clostridia bacterium]|nr:M23 family metallopeptidase [Clostridia bacterium]
MDKENRKVNRQKDSPSVFGPKAFEEIPDGLYDLGNIYSSRPKSREDELREREEKRRALEMQAIKEDIERRYSLQLEDAQSSSDSPKPLYIQPQTVDDESIVKEEIEHIDEIIGSSAVEIAPKKESKDEASAKSDAFEDNAVYRCIYDFGDTIFKFIKQLLLFVFRLIKIPFVKLGNLLGIATLGTKKRFKKYARATLQELVYFRREIKSALKSIKKAIKNPLSLPSVFAHYIKKAVSRHKKLLKTAVNTAMPVAAFLVLLLTVNYWNGVTFALEVIYNNKSIGYISDESVYIEARDMVRDRLSAGAGTVEATVASQASNLNAQYSLSLVSLEELNDAQSISDKMIENSVDNLTHACGIYIDGHFVCAVKNEADAKTVFNSILAPYETEAKNNGYIVGFAETIDYVQGLYRDDASVMWDASQLESTLVNEQGRETHITSEGETLESISELYGIGENELEKLNPDTDFEELAEGTVLTVREAEKYISIKKTVTTTSIRDIKYETVKRRDATKYSGYRSVVQKGVNGSERVTKTQIYIDGVLYDTEYSYETIEEAVDEIVTVGTKTSYNGVYIGEASSSGFLWPAPSCHYISSPYGWRNSGWHNGIDLVKSGGGALGTPVIASKSGRVEVVQRSSSGYGNMVLINHGDGYKTRYAHMVKGSIKVSVGDYVEAGQTIGKVGSTGNSTGPHLHFEVIVNGETRNPKNYIY